MLANDFYSSTINRSYYAIFYAANALLIAKDLFRKKHSGVLGEFRKQFIKTGIMDNRFSRIFGRAFEDRTESDYDLTSEATEVSARENLAGAIEFVDEVEKWLKNENWL
jgi:uncharacterized protein (UPF0332 family)